MRKKNRSPRLDPLSVNWMRLVFRTAEIDNPTKAQKRDVGRLWAAGYSHKDAAAEVKG